MKELLKQITLLSLLFAAPLFANPTTENISIFKKQKEVLNDGIEYLTYSADIDDGRFVFIVNNYSDKNDYSREAVARYIVGNNIYRVVLVEFCVDETDLCGELPTLLTPVEKFADTFYHGEDPTNYIWKITYVKNDKLVTIEEFATIPKVGDLNDFVGKIPSEEDEEEGMDSSIKYNEQDINYKPYILDWGYGPKVKP
ncbi:hypothetical protein [Gilliamella sp. M0364]|uniref:hypothetical protein n=1 Tax=Gilliamella sp. M0364 TaxID=2751011 RepID=UPI0018DB71DD|nr:hypothetical protein [Gilliamella sp. M0364]MBI0156179.1 hypothetical protein [Gilliamella sp. M0364]